MKRIVALLLIAVMIFCLAACDSGKSSSSSSNSSSSGSSRTSYSSSYSSGSGYSGSSSSYSSGSSGSSSSSSSSRAGLCQYKVSGTYVCNKKATNGGYCKEHYDYLNDAYESLTGHKK